MPFTPETTIYILYGLLIIAILSIVWVIWLEVRLRKLLKGTDGKSLEGVINSNKQALEKLESFRIELEQYLKNVEKRLGQGARGISIVRFNPFTGTGEGGKQSFAVALVNKEGDGVVLSSLYSRDKVSVFAKPVFRGKSEYELTGEEKQVIKEASDSLTEKGRN